MRRKSIMATNTSPLLQRDTLPMQVLSKLMDWIMDGTLKMGDKLNSEELARQLGVSRMPIREALSALEKMGLAESIPYVGMKLISLDQHDILQIYLMRLALEPMIAKYVCQHVTEEDLEELEALHAVYSEIIREPELDAKKLYQQNRRFHFKIYSISKMDRICSTIESLWDTLSFFKLLYGREIIRDNASAEDMIHEHQGYIDALRRRDAAALEKKIHDGIAGRIADISHHAAQGAG